MEITYTAYTKTIDNNVYYFVKKFLVLAEYKNLTPIPDGFGMHHNFEKACELAGIIDENIKKYLLSTIESNNTQAKIISITGNVDVAQKASGS